MKNKNIFIYLTPIFIILFFFLDYYLQSPKYEYQFTLDLVLLSLLITLPLLMLIICINKKLFNNPDVLIITSTFLSITILLNIKIMYYILAIIIYFLLNYLLRNTKNCIFSYISLFFIMVSLYIVVPDILKVCYSEITKFIYTDRKEINNKIIVNDNLEKPNIYYIHADGMMSIKDMNYFFGYKDTFFESYIKQNNFVLLDDSHVDLGHRTTTALTALFNPYYYDNKEKDYIESLKDYYINNKKGIIKNYISYSEISDKRTNNELISSLEKAGYETYAVGSYNQYTSLNVNYYFDFSDYNGIYKDSYNNLNLKQITSSTSNLKKQSYIELQRFTQLSNYTKLSQKINLDKMFKTTYSVNENMNLSEYPYLSKTQSLKSVALIKGISMIKKNAAPKFIFLDFDLNHLPSTFDSEGIINDNYFIVNKNNYKNNYIYSTHLLSEILNYIKSTDENAIIFVQGDHGIHTLDLESLSNLTNKSPKECINIWDSAISMYYIPEEYVNDDIKYLNNPLNISRYIINNYVGKNYQYIN